MPEHPDNIDILIFKYLQHSCTNAELQELHEWVNSSEDNRLQFEQLTKQDSLRAKLDTLSNYYEAKGWQKIKDNFPIQTQKKRSIWPALAVAAMAAFVIAGFYFIYYSPSKPNNETLIARKQMPTLNDVLPGKNKAILTLSDGSTITLDDSQNDTLAQQGNTKVLNLKGKLAYMPSANTSNEIVYNTISTPPGGQYQVVLPDGSQVWLNAASSIRFPANFSGKTRNVSVTGEVYFEVAHNRSMPFIISVNESEVKVLGTRFDVMAYGDESALEVTLLEGSVNFVKDQVQTLLKPGEQTSVNKDGKIKLLKGVDLEKIMAWKNGFFYFDNADLRTVMRQLSRWYNVNVEYRNGNSGDLFHVDIPRNMKLSEVLKALKLACDLNFEIQGKTIVVS